MYTREIQAPRPSPIEAGSPLQGTWTEAFKEVNLMDIHRPYGLALPRWLVNNRIREWQSFSVQDDRFFLHAILLNVKFLGAIQVLFYDKQTGERMKLRRLVAPNRFHLPLSLSNAYIDDQSGGFSFRIHDWLDARTILVDLNIEAGRRGQRPPFTAQLRYILPREAVTPLVVSLLFSGRRSMYAYKAVAEVRGDIVYRGDCGSLDPRKTAGLFCDYKGFFPYRTRGSWVNAAGIDGENRRIGFSLAENQTRENRRNNENALWVDGSLTPLPPVRITQPEGLESEWVIQDLEGMVDLSFKPQEYVRDSLNLLLARADYQSALGYFNGMLINAKGEPIPIRNLWGLGELFYLRV
ncbi:MAG: DUF2804 domain-containing protein [Treponema sp.]|jgi:hypothetical protein|nr:DUF2804 domain-containing protein [Treponema sp.]